MPDIKLLRGDRVIVKDGVLDPDLQFDIGGWQGRILEPEQAGIVIVA